MRNNTPKVRLELTLSTSPPHSISLSDPNLAASFKLTATLRITLSTKPASPNTLLTNWTVLDTSHSDAFVIGRMNSPQSTSDPSRSLKMKPSGFPYRIRPSGDLDLRKRDNLKFITVPAMGQGVATIEYDMSPARIFRYGASSLAGNLAHLHAGEKYRVTMSGAWLTWWTWGDLHGDLADKKFSRWRFPAGEDPEDVPDVASMLTDPVDHNDVNHLGSRSWQDDEEKPDVKQMIRDGWVFGEAEAYIEITSSSQEEGAVFEFVE